jgi:hypothetical protein
LENVDTDREIVLKRILEKCVCVWVQLAHDAVQLWAFVDTVTNFRVTKKRVIFHQVSNYKDFKKYPAPLCEDGMDWTR